MEFAQPAALALIALAVPVLALGFGLMGRRNALTVSGGRIFTAAPVTMRLRFARCLPILRALAIGLIAFGVAGPRLGDANAIVPAQGIDIVLSFDISSSMTSSNLGETRTRLEATKDVVTGFVLAREDDRVGLVVFRKDALLLSPATLDYEALAEMVKGVDDLTMEDGTGIGVGLATALNALKDSTAASRIVVLLTDGEHNAGSIRPDEAADLAESLKIRVYTIGVVTNVGGGSVGVDEKLLGSIAERTGGKYYSADNPERLADVYDEIAGLEKSGVGRDRYEEFTELAPWFVVPAALLLVLDLVLGATLLRRSPL